MEKLINELKNTLMNNKFILACSTGSDSMALFNLCIQSNLKNNMIVCHVNHCLREESIQEEEYITNLCKELNIKCYVKKLNINNTKENIEQIARDKRYEFFISTAKLEDCHYILTAHQADDQIETIIMRLLKSSSLRSYAGIEKESKREDIIIYRPLLEYSKETLRTYCINNNIKYYDDITNFEDDHLRNRIRKYITPYLLKENNNIYNSFNYFSETIIQADKLLEKQIKSFVNNKYIIEDNYSKFKIEDYLNIDNTSNWLRKQILFRLLKPYNLSVKQIDEIDNIIESNNQKVINNISNYLCIIKEYGYIYIYKETYKEIEYYQEIKENDIYYLPNNYEICVNDTESQIKSKNKKICYNINISKPFIIRSKKAGDVIERNNKNNKYNQKISNYLTTKKIPSFIKKDILLIEKDNKVVDVIGIFIK